MRVYTYYTPISLYPDDSQTKLIEVWARSWRKQGWEPIVLNEGDAMLHPLYSEFKQHISKLPTEYGHEYEGACFLRWLAMAAQETDGGGGMLTDYDYINYGFSPRAPGLLKMQIFCEPPPIEVTMGLVLAPRMAYEEFCKIVLSWKPSQADWNPNAKLYHCSDLSLLVRMFEHKNFVKPDWMEKVHGFSGLFPRESYKTAPLVHYGYEMKHAGLWPKYKHIEKLRPFE